MHAAVHGLGLEALDDALTQATATARGCDPDTGEFGDASINIAGMQIARQNAGGQALSVLTIDSPAPEGLLEKVRLAIDADLLREIDITE